jgi:glycine cleavage system regulatory protein
MSTQLRRNPTPAAKVSNKAAAKGGRSLSNSKKGLGNVSRTLAPKATKGQAAAYNSLVQCFPDLRAQSQMDMMMAKQTATLYENNAALKAENQLLKMQNDQLVAEVDRLSKLKAEKDLVIENLEHRRVTEVQRIQQQMQAEIAKRDRVKLSFLSIQH